MATSEQKKRKVGGRTSLEIRDVTFSSRETSMEVDNAGDALPQMARNSGEGDLVESLVALLGCIQGDNKRMTEDNARLNEITKKDQSRHKTSSDRDSEEKIKFAEVQMKDVFRQIAGQQIEAQKSEEAALRSQLEDAKTQLASMSDQLHASYADGPTSVASASGDAIASAVAKAKEDAGGTLLMALNRLFRAPEVDTDVQQKQIMDAAYDAFK
ncbi:hypothetical protein B484DRAFT_467217 [Ochromonadaceae sp. CCMP2298]|nr:hypothetical protein B484DRAFT_467217 [Ochromonadaceae sp. CCMP2298]